MDTPISIISLSQIQLVDIFLRSATAGLLALFFFFQINNGKDENKFFNLALLVCLASYALLTAPIEDIHYGWVRPPLHLLTNLTPYALLAVYWYKIRGITLYSAMPVWLRYLFVGWLIGLFYFFVAMKGIGEFLRVQHLIGLLILLIIVFDAIRDFNDDLNESRRDIRKLAITLISLYATALTVIEIFFRWVKDEWIFSLSNAFLLFACSLWFVHRALIQSMKTSSADLKKADPVISNEGNGNNAVLNELLSIMSNGCYRQNGLTIRKLSADLDIPEHKLRVLINQQLGFDNFSQFLNSYRIPAICEKLENPKYHDIPILTLALDNGYNSIAPFNRAFKELKGVTPSEYRNQFL